jgi:hypothetical protein
MARIEISSDLIVRAMQSKPVRDALKARAEKVRARADALAKAEKTETQPPEVAEGTRPKGRPFARVSIPDGADQEWGTSRTERRRILGRAAEGS